MYIEFVKFASRKPRKSTLPTAGGKKTVLSDCSDKEVIGTPRVSDERGCPRGCSPPGPPRQGFHLATRGKCLTHFPASFDLRLRKGVDAKSLFFKEKHDLSPPSDGRREQLVPIAGRSIAWPQILRPCSAFSGESGDLSLLWVQLPVLKGDGLYFTARSRPQTN